jgi:hypothetical protein
MHELVHGLRRYSDTCNMDAIPVAGTCYGQRPSVVVETRDGNMAQEASGGRRCHRRRKSAKANHSRKHVISH